MKNTDMKLKNIYKSKPAKNKKHVSVADSSAESPIGADPYNPILMQKVPERPAGYEGLQNARKERMQQKAQGKQ
ncbi:hypothetical protein L596_022851 [Steinernema carpocapsae]|uniref:Uncharacterized protein n=1 Tax=Steinernema carpocapsae TaxID=34508 RepID=A0A4U5MMZ1_STECR|nr:hypothetical protein L596_022851 [Steinernema carpocapsae]